MGPPTATLITSPLGVTFATVESLDAHVITRPFSGSPAESRAVATNAAVTPGYSVAAVGVTVTAATCTGMTLIVAVRLWPSLVAVIVTGSPIVMPVTRPVALTVATAESLVDQLMIRPVRGSPGASVGVAVSCCVSYTGTLAVAGVTETDATGTGMTRILAVAVTPSLVAVITGSPIATAVTRPVAFTVARVSLLSQVTVRP